MQINFNRSYESYVGGGRIKFINEIVNDIEIKVSNEHTSFVNVTRQEKIDLHELVELHKKVTKLARSLGCKVSNKNGSLAYIKGLIATNEYECDYNKYTSLFNQLVFLWKSKINEGMYVGYADDLVYQELIVPLQGEINKFFYVNARMGTVREIKHTYEALLNELENHQNGVMTQIYL